MPLSLCFVLVLVFSRSGLRLLKFRAGSMISRFSRWAFRALGDYRRGCFQTSRQKGSSFMKISAI